MILLHSVASILKIIFYFSFPFCSDFNLLAAFLAVHAVTVTYILHTTLSSERFGARWGIRGGGQSKWVYSINMAWPLNNLFLKGVSQMFKCHVLVENFDRNPAMSWKTLKLGFFNTLLWLNQGFGELPTPQNLFTWLLESIYILRVYRNRCAFLHICYKICIFLPK